MFSLRSTLSTLLLTLRKRLEITNGPSKRHCGSGSVFNARKRMRTELSDCTQHCRWNFTEFMVQTLKFCRVFLSTKQFNYDRCYLLTGMIVKSFIVSYRAKNLNAGGKMCSQVYNLFSFYSLGLKRCHRCHVFSRKVCRGPNR